MWKREREMAGRAGSKKWTGRLSAAELLSTVFAGAVPGAETGRVFQSTKDTENTKKRGAEDVPSPGTADLFDLRGGSVTFVW
jgi:hypothetical protein